MDVDLMIERQEMITQTLSHRSDITVESTEEFNPPHKPANFSPYDIVLIFDYNPQNGPIHTYYIRQLLFQNQIEFDEVINVASWREDKQIAYISLVKW